MFIGCAATLLRLLSTVAATSTWSTTDKDAGVQLSNGNLTTTGSGSYSGVRGTLSKSTGKWYFEMAVVTLGFNVYIGVSNSTSSLTTSSSVGKTVQGKAGYTNNNTTFIANAGFVMGDVIGVALDADAKQVSFYVNGVLLQGPINISGITGPYFPVIVPNATNDVETTNFGATAFAFTLPSGFTAWG